MRGLNKKRAILVLLIFGILVNILPIFIDSISAGNIDSIVQNISLVKTNADPRVSYTVMNDNDTYNQLENKYYIRIDWKKNKLNDIQPNDEFIVDVEGLLLQDSASPCELQITNKSNPSVILPSVGTARVESGAIVVKFNDNIKDPEVVKYGDLEGSIFVRNTVDFNKFIGNTDFTVNMLLGGNTFKSLALKHEDLTPTYETLMRDMKVGGPFLTKVTNLIPADNMEAKTTISPKPGYIIVDFDIKYTFNDYSLEFLNYVYKTGNLEPRDPELNGVVLSDYDFTRLTTTERRPSGLSASEKLALKSDWNLDPRNVPEFSTSSDMNFIIGVHGITDNDFMNFEYTIQTAVNVVYKIFYEDEVLSDIIVGNNPSDVTDITIKYVYFDEKEGIYKELVGDGYIDNVSVNSTEYFDYKPPANKVKEVNDKGYEIGNIENISSLNPEKGKNIIRVICIPTSKLTDVRVKYIYVDDNGVEHQIEEEYFDNVSLDDSKDYIPYNPKDPIRDSLAKKGYGIKNIVDLKQLDPEKGKNIIIVYCVKLTKTTDVTVRYVYVSGGQYVDLPGVSREYFDPVPLESTEFFNYKPPQHKIDEVNSKDYVIDNVIDITKLVEEKGKNVILVVCVPADITDVTVKYGYYDTSGIFREIIGEEYFPNVPVTSQKYYNYDPPTTKKNEVTNAGYYISKVENISQLDSRKGYNVIRVVCIKGTAPTTTTRTTTTRPTNTTRTTTTRTTTTRTTRTTTTRTTTTRPTNTTRTTTTYTTYTTTPTTTPTTPTNRSTLPTGWPSLQTSGGVAPTDQYTALPSETQPLGVTEGPDPTDDTPWYPSDDPWNTPTDDYPWTPEDPGKENPVTGDWFSVVIKLSFVASSVFILVLLNKKFGFLS